MGDVSAQSQQTTSVLVREAVWPEDEAIAVPMLRAYADFLIHNPAGAVNICLQGYEEELSSLADRYSMPNGVLLLAFCQHKAAGCVAVKVRHDRPGACEMKRLWVCPGHRGRKLGETLTEAVIRWAESNGFAQVLLDTVPGAMPQAAALYRSMGFRETARHNDNPVDGLVFFERTLR